jgi:hypothetical protein
MDEQGLQPPGHAKHNGSCFHSPASVSWILSDVSDFRGAR